jgi:predicted secreted hydrolase
MHQLGVLLLCCGLVLTGCEQTPPAPAELQVAEALGGAQTQGYARAFEVRPFRFPDDHGAHPQYRNEWWYLTGNLQAPDGRRFGFQFTLFRIALISQPLTSPSAWRTNQIWMGHAALSDIAAGEHYQAPERFARQGLELAGANSRPFRVWLEDWQLAETPDGTWRLALPTETFLLDLKLERTSPIILQGDRGLSQKSAEPGNASYYYSIPRLQAAGTLYLDSEELPVSGLAWLDREWSTSVLGPAQAGWDWFSLQLEDGRNLMYYQLRRKDGTVDPHSAGTLSDITGLGARLGATDVILTPLEYWEADDRRYPILWRMQVAGEGPWLIRALLSDQEMRTTVRYWEGVVEVVDEKSDKILGHGYLEMAGYAAVED